MQQQSATRGRWIVTLGAIVIVGSAFMQWWTVGGGPNELSAQSGDGISDGRGFVMFLACIATLLLVTLPFASEKTISLDNPVAYLGLFAVALGTYIWRVAILVQAQMVPVPPARGLGLWFAAAGLGILARGVFELFEERRRRLY